VVPAPAPTVVVVQQPVVYAPPPVIVQPAPVVVQPAPVVAVPTITEFAATFKPTPGCHRVTVQHPVTCKPVEVCFTLPAGCGCPKVHAHRQSLCFDYGRTEVTARFLHGGRVEVVH
jgi:hypothetical protein